MTGFKLMVPLSTFGKITNQKIQTRHYQSTTGPLDKRLVLSRAEAMSGHPLRRLLTHRDSLRGAATCPKLGEDWKSRAEGQTGANDPERTSAANLPVMHNVRPAW